METTTVRPASPAATEASSSGEHPAASACSAATGTGSPPAVNVSRLGAEQLTSSTPPRKKHRSRLGVLAALQIKTDVKTLGALLDQFYEKRRLLILSAPNMSDPDYQLQNIMIQVRALAGFTLSTNDLRPLRSFCPSSRSEVGMRVGPATRHADRAPGLAATGDGPH